ncbi:MAG: long-chain-acyl-CoA synthetase [Rhodocyclaceae bacterium]|nr:long-chain-acyl-CoA synthetase [Rhodocyclaceae bacterium]
MAISDKPASDKVGLLAVGRAALRLAPTAPRALRAALNVALLKPDSAQSIGQLLDLQARKNPNKDFLLFEGLRWNYRDFNVWANRIALVLQARGVQHGDSVGLLFDNCPDLLACVAATVKLGAVAGMLNPNQRGEVLRHSVELIKPHVLIVGDDCVAALQTAFPTKRRGAIWFWVGRGTAPSGFESLPDAVSSIVSSVGNDVQCRLSTADPLRRRKAVPCEFPASPPPQTQKIKASDPCFLIFTSGTTGMPKASVMTHMRWLKSGYGIGQMALRLRADDVFYCPLPFYHNNALTLSWSAVMTSGATLAMARKFSASKFWDDIRGTRATAFVYIGELCRYLLARPPSAMDKTHNIRVAIGNGLRAEIWDEFQARFGIAHICEFYGSSEGNLVFINALGLSRTAGFSAQAYAIVAFDTHSEQAMRDGRGFMQRVPRGESGLLITEVTAGSPFDGYTDASANEAKLLRNVFKRGDTWINSGDLVREQGFRHIAFVDRVGDTFRWKGENVATTEVEGALATLDGVEQGSVYGVSVPHADGRAGMAALVMNAGAKFNPRTAAQHLTQALPAYAVPLFIRLISAHETTATFKIRKVDLKQQGFDPTTIQDPLFILRDKQKGYEPLTAAIYAELVQGNLRL